MKAPFLVRVIGFLLTFAAFGRGAAPLCAGEPAWQVLETPRFTVVSQLAAKPTRAWAEEFNQFIEELRRVFKTSRDYQPALTVVLFARDRDFTAYKPIGPDGRTAMPVDGFFNHDGSWSAIGLAEHYRDESTRELIFHEGVHWFLSADPVKYPVWLDEGLAEVFSTFRHDGQKVRWGTDIPAHVSRLRAEPMLPFEQFFYTTRADPLFNESQRNGMFYAQSWVFVHYLMFGNHDRPRDTISTYFDLLAGGSHPDAAFKQAFGDDYQNMGRTLSTYIRTGKYFKVTRWESSAAKISAPVQLASPYVVDIALGRLALASGRNELARQHANQALAGSTQLPQGFELLAAVERRAGDEAAAFAACSRATLLGSQDANTLFLLAYLTARGETERGDFSGRNVRAVANLYRQAIKANPTMVEAYNNLAALAPALDPVEDADLAALKEGGKRFPHRGEIVLGLATMVAQRGNRAVARDLVDEARKRGLPLPEERRAQQMEQCWLCDEYTKRINSLVGNERYGDALSAYDELIPQVSDASLRGVLQHNRQMVAIQVRTAAAEAAVRNRDYPTARRGFEALLGESDLPPTLRRTLESRLRQLSSIEPTAATIGP